MCPQHNDEALMLLRTGDLGRFRAGRLRRHMARCAECRVEWEAIAGVWELARVETESVAASVSETALPRLREHIRAQINGGEVGQVTVRHTHRPVVSRRMALGAATLGVAGIAAAFLVPGTPTRPTIAFAQVERAMGSIRTVTWRETGLESVDFFPDGKVRVERKPRSAILWARLEPATLVRFWGSRGRDVLRENDSFQIEDTGRGRHYSYFPWGIPSSIVFGPEKQQTAKDRIRAFVLFPQSPDKSAEEWTDAQGSASLKVERGAWTSKEAVLNGKRVQRFDTRVRYKQRVISSEEGRGFWEETGQTWTIWAERDTYRVVRRQIRTRYEGFGKTFDTTRISDQFRYNVEPPAGIFDVEPPIGSKYSFVPLPERPATQEELAGIQQAVQRAFDAWSRRDEAAYATAWDFDYLIDGGQGKRRQMTYMRDEYPLRQMRIQRGVGSASTRISSMFRNEGGDITPFPPAQSREFRTGVMVTGIDRGGIQRRGLLLPLNLCAENGDFRLVRAEFESLQDQIDGTSAEAARLMKKYGDAEGIRRWRQWKKNRPSGTVPRPGGRR